MGNEKQPILLFDGYCNLCIRSVGFIARHDRTGKIRFASLKSEFAQDFLRKEDLKRKGVDSLIMVEDGSYKTKSDAVLEAAGMLDRPWNHLRFLKVFPRSFRDWVYDLVAMYRYKVFGKPAENFYYLRGFENRFLQ